MTPPLILLPPSEGKASGGTGPVWELGTMVGSALPTGAALDTARAKVTAATVRAMKQSKVKRAALLGVKGDALEAATATNLVVRSSATMPAIDRYTGVLYDALAASTLSARDRRRLNAQVRIFSGMWGIVGPDDPIPNYKLKMGARLDKLGRLSSMWKPHIDAALGLELAGRTVWNLLPNEHDAAWSGASIATAEVSVRFLDDVLRSGARQLVIVSHWNKLLKGALVRHVLANQLAEPDGLARFDHPLGYKYVSDLTEIDGNRTIVSMVARRE